MARKMTPAELDCMLNHGSHDYELYETPLDRLRNWWHDRRATKQGENFSKVALHSRCKRCKRAVRA